MHELAICQSIIQQVEQVAAQNNASKVTKITLQIGPLSGVETPLLQQAFPIANTGTIAQDAILEVQELPIRVRCNMCQHENEASMNKLLCTACGSWQTTLLSGDEMLLTSVELEKQEETAHV